MEWLLLIVGGAWLTIWLLKMFAENASSAANERRRAGESLSAERSALQSRQLEFNERAEALEKMERRVAAFKASLSDPKLTPRALFVDVAKAVADFQGVLADELAHELETKKHPALKAAEEVRQQAARLREVQREAKYARYVAALYERMVPWISEFVDQEYPASPTRAVDAGGDPSREFLSEDEYTKLTPAARNQLALDRYWKSRRTSWQIGRDYERYVGYVWESKGCDIQYHGIEEGLEDLGRDLIARRAGECAVIQCKWWAAHRTVHERHIYQLFGTSVDLALAMGAETASELTLFSELLPRVNVRPIFVTSTKLSDKAKQVARVLGVEVMEQFPMAKYPCIKCNVSRSGSERIYHLPFDQQYDNVKIEPLRGEKYTATIAEAERDGFRRAWRWRGPGGE